MPRVSSHCLDSNTGKKLWQRSLNQDYGAQEGRFPVASSPLLESDRLILNVGGTAGDSGIVALDKRTGQTLWTATEHGGSRIATPVAATLHGRRVVFVFTKEGLVSLEPGSGRVGWSIPFRREERRQGQCHVARGVRGPGIRVRLFAGQPLRQGVAGRHRHGLWRDLRRPGQPVQQPGVPGRIRVWVFHHPPRLPLRGFGHGPSAVGLAVELGAGPRWRLAAASFCWATVAPGIAGHRFERTTCCAHDGSAHRGRPLLHRPGVAPRLARTGGRKRSWPVST